MGGTLQTPNNSGTCDSNPTNERSTFNTWPLPPPGYVQHGGANIKFWTNDLIEMISTFTAG